MPNRSKSIAAKAKLLRVKKITRNEALSYNRTIPNGLGVTAISAVNGRGSYASRYAATRGILAGAEPNGDGMFFYKNRHKRGVKLRGKAKESFLSLMAAGKRKSTKRKSTKRKSTKRASTKCAPTKRSTARPNRKMSARRSKSTLRRMFVKPPKPRRGSYLANRVSSATEASKDYQIARRQQDINILRFDLRYDDLDDAGKARVKSQIDALEREIAGLQGTEKPKKKRKKPGPVTARRYAGKYKTVRKHVKGGFQQQLARVGNKTYRTFMYTTSTGKTRKIPDWAIAGAKSAKAFKGPTKRKLALDTRRARIAEIVSKKIKQGSYPFTPNTMTFREWKKTMKIKNRKPKRKAKKQLRASRRNPVRQAAANPLMQAAANKRRRRNGKRSAQARKGLKARRLRGLSKLRRNGVASYISNLGSSDQIVSVLKTGVVVTTGLVAHKALTALLIENVEFFQTTKFGKSIASVAVAALGIPAAGMVKGALGSQVQIGMGASLVHSVLVDLLAASGQDKLVSYLGDYTEASRGLPAAGYGSYYEFAPGQQYSGTGAYYEFAPGQQYSGMNGVGEYIETGASGFGDYMQAAAGFGSPALMQAAAGVGEYIVTGAQGIGEYEQVAGEYTQPAHTHEGIAPSLSAAEQALTIAEAAAGVGGMGNVDAGLQQIVYPQGQALDIGDQPGGSRAGVFYGGNGVFGP